MATYVAAVDDTTSIAKNCESNIGYVYMCINLYICTLKIGKFASLVCVLNQIYSCMYFTAVNNVISIAKKFCTD